MAMSPKQQAFCDFYIETANATESYRRAGYKARGNSAEASASQLLRNPKVRAYIDARLAAKESDRIASQDEVLQFLTSVLRAEVTETVPVVLKTHYEMVTKEPGISDRLRAAEDLAKRYGLFKESIDINANALVRFVDDVPDE